MTLVSELLPSSQEKGNTNPGKRRLQPLHPVQATQAKAGAFAYDGLSAMQAGIEGEDRDTTKDIVI